MNPKLYIGNLSPEVTEEELRDLFSRAGVVTKVELTVDPVTRQSRGFGFVTMAEPQSAATALRDFHSYQLGGRHITVTEARASQPSTGLMSEGFDSRTAAAFRPGAQQRNNGQRSAGRKGFRRKGAGKNQGRKRRPW